VPLGQGSADLRRLVSAGVQDENELGLALEPLELAKVALDRLPQVVGLVVDR
jgi:hypothetical protein